MSSVGQQALLMAGATAATLTFQGATSFPSTGQTVTFTAVPIGDAASGRYVFVAIPYILGGSTNISIASVTIGGVNATIHTQIFEPPEVAVGGVALVSAPVPNGTTADIVVTWAASGSLYEPEIAVYRVTGLRSLTPVDIKALAPVSTTVSATVNVVKGGIVIVCFHTYSSGATSRTMTGLPTDYTVSPSSGRFYLGGGEQTSADGTVTAVVNSTTSQVWSAVMASFR